MIREFILRELKGQKGEMFMYISLFPVEFPFSCGFMGMDSLSQGMI